MQFFQYFFFLAMLFAYVPVRRFAIPSCMSRRSSFKEFREHRYTHKGLFNYTRKNFPGTQPNNQHGKLLKKRWRVPMGPQLWRAEDRLEKFVKKLKSYVNEDTFLYESFRKSSKGLQNELSVIVDSFSQIQPSPKSTWSQIKHAHTFLETMMAAAEHKEHEGPTEDRFIQIIYETYTLRLSAMALLDSQGLRGPRFKRYLGKVGKMRDQLKNIGSEATPLDLTAPPRLRMIFANQFSRARSTISVLSGKGRSCGSF